MLQKWPRILLVILVSRLDWLEGMGRVDRGAGLRERFGFRGWGGTGPGLKGWEKVGRGEGYKDVYGFGCREVFLGL